MEKNKIPEVKIRDSLEKELEALKIICGQLEGLQDETKGRIFQYLKSRFRETFPYTND